jgi:hypothetical protein
MKQRTRVNQYLGDAAHGEWPTWLVTVVVYGGWLLALRYHNSLTLLRQVLHDVCTPDAIETPASRLRLAGFAKTQIADYDRILATRCLVQDCFYPELA